MSQPACPGALRASEIAGRLREAAGGPHHAFWADEVNLLAPGTLDWDLILDHRRVTDAYLLALAVRHAGRFVTFDLHIDRVVVRDARTEHLLILD